MTKEIKITLTKEEFETLDCAIDIATDEMDLNFEIEDLHKAIGDNDWDQANHITFKHLQLKNASEIIYNKRKEILEDEKSEDKYKGNDYGL